VGNWQGPLQPLAVNIGVNVSAWALCAAKHKAKTGHNTAPRALNGMDIRNLSINLIPSGNKARLRDFIYPRYK
jgi:hypothetical protein